MIYIAEVREEHIKNGARTSTQHCALALAIRESHPNLGEPLVLSKHILLCEIEGERKLRVRTKLKMSTDVRNFVWKYALTTFPARPFTLVLDTGAKTALRFDSLTHHRPGAINWFGETDFGEAGAAEPTDAAQ